MQIDANESLCYRKEIRKKIRFDKIETEIVSLAEDSAS